MKKVFLIILSVIILVAVAAGCSAKTDNGGSVDQTGNPKDTAAVSETATTEVTTATAKIKDNDAIKLIESYSAEELSLTKKQKKNCTFLVSSTGTKIKDDYYIRVSAVVKNENGKDSDGNTLYTFDYKGEYYIRFDGKQVLKKDMSSEKEKYTELELKANKKD